MITFSARTSPCHPIRMAVTGMLMALLLAVIIFPCQSSADDTAIRLAVLPEGNARQIQSVVDLLTVRLSKAGGIEVVERAKGE